MALLRVDPGWYRQCNLVSTFLPFAFQEKSEDVTVCEAKVHVRGGYRTAPGRADSGQLRSAGAQAQIATLISFFQRSPSPKRTYRGHPASGLRAFH